MLPRVRIDYRNHPLYTIHDFYREYPKVWDAEILSISITKGTMRVRLYEIETGNLFRNNHDTSIEYIVPGQQLVLNF